MTGAARTGTCDAGGRGRPPAGGVAATLHHRDPIMRSRTAHPWRIALAFGVLAGLLAAAGMTYIAWLNNPSDAARGPGYVEWAGLAIVAAGWFVAVAAVATLLARVLVGLGGRRRAAPPHTVR